MSDDTTMIDQIERWAHAAINTNNVTAKTLIQNGVAPLVALDVAGILTRESVSEELRRQLHGRSAAHITHTIKTGLGSARAN